MTQTQTRPRQRIPVWLAVLIILIAVAGGGWFVYRGVFGGDHDATADSIVVEPGFRRSPVQANPSMAARWGLGGPAEGILKRGGGPITARRGNAFFRASQNKSGYNINFDYLSSVRQSWVTPAQWALHQLALRVVENDELAKQLKVTDDQKKKLQALSYAVPITAAERSSLEALLIEWDKATGAAKDPAGVKLLDAIAKVGAAHLEASKAALVRRVQQIPTILTAQQVQQARGAVAAPAATRPAAPATRPASRG